MYPDRWGKCKITTYSWQARSTGSNIATTLRRHRCDRCERAYPERPRRGRGRRRRVIPETETGRCVVVPDLIPVKFDAIGGAQRAPDGEHSLCKRVFGGWMGVPRLVGRVVVSGMGTSPYSGVGRPCTRRVYLAIPKVALWL